MSISSYQIQGIIQTYNRQLKSRLTQRSDQPKEQSNALAEDVVKISDEGKKHLLLERVGSDAVKNLKQQALEPLKR